MLGLRSNGYVKCAEFTTTQRGDDFKCDGESKFAFSISFHRATVRRSIATVRSSELNELDNWN